MSETKIAAVVTSETPLSVAKQDAQACSDMLAHLLAPVVTPVAAIDVKAGPVSYEYGMPDPSFRFKEKQKVWFSTANRRPLAGVVRECYAMCEVGLMESARRVCVQTGERSPSEVKLSWNGPTSPATIMGTGEAGDELVATWITGETIPAQDIKKEMSIIPKGSKYHMRDESGVAPVGGTVHLLLEGFAYDAGVELAQAVDGWHWIVTPSSAKAKILSTTNKYTIVGQWSDTEPSVAELDTQTSGEKCVKGEIYSNIDELRISLRD